MVRGMYSGVGALLGAAGLRTYADILLLFWRRGTLVKSGSLGGKDVICSSLALCAAMRIRLSICVVFGPSASHNDACN